MLSEGSVLAVNKSQNGDNLEVVGSGFGDSAPTWDNGQLRTDSDMLYATIEGDKVTIHVKDAATVYPGLSDGMIAAVNDLYTTPLNNVDSEYMGIQVLSRATNNRFLDSSKTASTIESAARMDYSYRYADQQWHC